MFYDQQDFGTAFTSSDQLYLSRKRVIGTCETSFGFLTRNGDYWAIRGSQM